MDIKELGEANEESFLELFGKAQVEAGETLAYEVRSENFIRVTALSDGTELPAVVSVRSDRRKAIYDGWCFSWNSALNHGEDFDIVKYLRIKREHEAKLRGMETIRKVKKAEFAERLALESGLTVERLQQLHGEYENL